MGVGDRPDDGQTEPVSPIVANPLGVRFTPTAAFAIQATLPRSGLVTSSYTPPNGYFPIGPWAGLGVLAAYTAAALGAAAWLVRRRDAV